MVVTGAFGPFGGCLLGSVSGGLDSALCRPSWSMPALARGRRASASASPSLGPGNGILRAETGGGFQAQNAGERPEFCSQTALRLANRPKLREFLWIRKPRRFAGTSWFRAVFGRLNRSQPATGDLSVVRKRGRAKDRGRGYQGKAIRERLRLQITL